MNTSQKIRFISMGSAFFLSACGENSTPPTGDGDNNGASPLIEPLAPDGWADAAGGFVSRRNEPAGYVVIADSPGGGIIMRIDLRGLSQGWHGIHLHQIADCSDFAEGFKASGGHIDPDDLEHGLLNPNGPERADLPNVYAGADGRATAEIFNASVALTLSEAALTFGTQPLIDEDGFSIIIHQNADDHMTQPIGGAGERVACAAIRAEL